MNELVRAISVISKESEESLIKKWRAYMFNLGIMWRLADNNIYDLLYLIYYDYVFHSPYISYAAGKDTSIISILDREPSNCFDSTLFCILSALHFNQFVRLSITDVHCWLTIGNKHLETTYRSTEPERIRFVELPKETGPSGIQEISNLREMIARYIINLLVNSENLRERRVISYSEDKFRHEQIYKILEEGDLLKYLNDNRSRFVLAKTFLFSSDIESALKILERINLSESSSAQELLSTLLSIIIDYPFWRVRFTKEIIFAWIRRLTDRVEKFENRLSIETLIIKIRDLLSNY
jgi:hypothetical protein